MVCVCRLGEVTRVQQQAEWTYELPKAGAGSAGLEDGDAGWIWVLRAVPAALCWEPL
jgi:hypothetical protein